MDFFRLVSIYSETGKRAGLEVQTAMNCVGEFMEDTLFNTLLSSCLFKIGNNRFFLRIPSRNHHSKMGKLERVDFVMKLLYNCIKDSLAWKGFQVLQSSHGN